MIAIVERVFPWILFLIGAPLVSGLIHRVKAWVAGRRGPPILQLYFDLARLWRKGVVWSDTASPGHLAAAAVVWISVAGAAMLMPAGAGGPVVGFEGDAIFFVYLLGLGRFALAWGALETGSSFEGMGAAREVSYAVLAEVATWCALLALGLQAGSFQLSSMLGWPPGPGIALLAAGLMTVLLAENCRVPFDDPNTHLELTMIHEVMVLDHSGPPLAVLLHGASLKFVLYAVLLAQVILPVGRWGFGWGLSAIVAMTMGIAVAVGLVESLLARLAFRRVPLVLTAAILSSLFALLIAWRTEP